MYVLIADELLVNIRAWVCTCRAWFTWLECPNWHWRRVFFPFRINKTCLMHCHIMLYM